MALVTSDVGLQNMYDQVLSRLEGLLSQDGWNRWTSHLDNVDVAAALDLALIPLDSALLDLKFWGQSVGVAEGSLVKADERGGPLSITTRFIFKELLSDLEELDSVLFGPQPSLDGAKQQKEAHNATSVPSSGEGGQEAESASKNGWSESSHLFNDNEVIEERVSGRRRESATRHSTRKPALPPGPQQLRKGTSSAEVPDPDSLAGTGTEERNKSEQPTKQLKQGITPEAVASEPVAVGPTATERKSDDDWVWGGVAQNPSTLKKAKKDRKKEGLKESADIATNPRNNIETSDLPKDHPTRRSAWVQSEESEVDTSKSEKRPERIAEERPPKNDPWPLEVQPGPAAPRPRKGPVTFEAEDKWDRYSSNEEVGYHRVRFTNVDTGLLDEERIPWKFDPVRYVQCHLNRVISN
ncbi:hypothetical protein H2199_002702 [Coniosporium tulheliwenetii]|uniref:Uncharacterized protein n=1 Tax=Coniosporium tulheliwenetii TaxID=3383036 RepID=A0ACC2ZG85_9PEZI|nr:hypothetical protein H2199_002702 [Cladosporium sp. JES 115]